jgi:hypothetical protein
MSTVVSIIAVAGLGLLLAWFALGLLLRLAGATLGVVALIEAAGTGSLGLLLLAAFGGATWLAGHWIFAMRHHYFRSPLARRAFLRLLPARLGPTRDWGIPIVDRTPR